MIATVEVLELSCDSCQAKFEYYDEGATVLFDTVDSAEGAGEAYDWSTDGEGKHHCPDCPTLTLSEEAIAERARVAAAKDAEPLEGL